MTDISGFITEFMIWVAQFVVVSTVLLVATHLFAKKRREQKRRQHESLEQSPAEEQGGSITGQTVASEDAEPVKVG